MKKKGISPGASQKEESLIGKPIQAQEESWKSGQHYYQLFHSSPLATITLNQNGVIIEANLTAADLLGRQIESLEGKPFIELINHEDQPLFQAIQKGLNSKSPPHISTLRLVKTDGTIINSEIRFVILKEEGRKTIFQLTITDSTRQNNMDNEFYHLAERQQAILSALPDILTEVDNDKVYTWVNQAGIEFFGPDVIGRPASDFFEGEQETYQTVKPLFNGHKDVIYVESWQRRKDSQKRLLAWHCRVLKDPNGNITGALSLAHDITDRQQAEEKLVESEQRFRSLFQNVQSIAVQGYDPAGNTLYWNKASELLYGYSADEAIGLNLLELIIPPEMNRAVAKAIKQMAKTGQPIPSAELLLMRKDGSRVSVYSSHAIVQLPGRDQELFCIDIDLTKLKEAEAQREAALNKLQESETLLNETQRISKTGGWEWDNIEKTLTWTEETYRIHDMDPKAQPIESQAHIAKSIECYDPQYRSLVLDSFNRCVETGEPYDLEVTFTSDKGRRLWVRTVAHAIRKNGMVFKVIGNMIDITERKQAEIQREEALQKLRESENLLNDTQQLSMVGGWVWDNTRKIMTWTDETFRLHDMEPVHEIQDAQKLIVKSLSCYDPADQEVVANTYQRCVELGEPYDLVVPFTTVKGRRLWVRTTAHAVIENGSVKKVIGNLMDITAVKQAELEREATLVEFRRSESRYRALFEQAAVGVGLVRTITGQYVDINRKFCEMVGYSREELLTADFQTVTHPEDIQENVDKNALLLNGSIAEFSIDKRYIRKDGSIIWVNLTASPLWKPGEEVDEYYHIAVVQDITDRKQAELKLQFLSLHDALTGLNNRAFFEESMEHLSLGRLFPISVLMADVDGLKETNDTLGHDAGDQLLKRAANALRATFRVEDVIARIGGDEFAVLLPDTSSQEMAAALPRLQSAIDELNAGCDGPVLQLSFGTCTAEQGDSLIEALKKADANMYIQRQKRNGDSR